MLIPFLIVAILLGLCVWVVVHTRRLPQVPEHERRKRLTDPAAKASSMRGPDSGGF